MIVVWHAASALSALPRPAMTLEQLKIFVEAARYGSFTLAASKLGLTQSAISISMRKLEERHDVILFNRAGNGLLLTEAGRILLAEAQRILLEVELTIKRVESYQDVQDRRMLLACSRNAYDYWMPGIITRLIGQEGLPRLELVVGRTEDVTAWVMRGTVDLGLSESPPGHSPFRYWEVFTDTLKLYATEPVQQRLPRTFGWAQLEDIAPVLWESDTDLEHFVLDAITANDLHEKRLRHQGLRLSSSAAILSAVRAGRHPGFINERLVRSCAVPPDLVALGDFDIPVQYWLFGPRSHDAGPLAAAMAREARRPIDGSILEILEQPGRAGSSQHPN
jgi:DNA-binding transcriptional LysR family regulator